jgi:hypothetical protein
LKLIIYKNIYAKLKIYCIFISNFENKILKTNPKESAHVCVHFNETGVIRLLIGELPLCGPWEYNHKNDSNSN